MTDVIIESSKITPTGAYITAACGKTRADIAVSEYGVYVTCKNASNRVWRGAGRRFNSIAEALLGYRSDSMKNILAAVAEIAG